MTEIQNSKRYDLEERTQNFASKVRTFIKKLSRNIANIEDVRQLVRSSGSIGANYIEANESLGRKDFIMRIKIARKEAKESVYWLRLIIETHDENYKKEGLLLMTEATELKKILSSMVER